MAAHFVVAATVGVDGEVYREVTVSDRNRRGPARGSTPQANRPRPRAPVRRARTSAWLAAGGVVGAALVLVIGVILAARAGVRDGAQAGPPPATVQAVVVAQGRPAPDFTATTFGGSQLTLSSLRGKPVLINFFASWCTVCQVELPGIEQAYRENQAGGFTVVGVNTLENGDGPAFYRKMNLTFPAVYDPGDPGRIGAAYGVTQGLPASVFVDRTGTVRLIQYGPVTRELIDQELLKL